MSANAVALAVVRVAALLASVMLVAPCAAIEFDFAVNSTLDQPDDLTIPGKCHTAAGTCTLRAALMQANRHTGGETYITLPAGTYVLTLPPSGADGEDSGDLDATTPTDPNSNLKILGAGPGKTIIDANHLDRALHVHPGRGVTIGNLTIRNGNATRGLGFGGGIYNEGGLYLFNVTIAGNRAAAGGGLANTGSAFTTDLTTITDNSAVYEGGGIFSEGYLELRDTTISHNAAAAGGGIMNRSGNAYILTSTVSENDAGTDGGGIANNAKLFIVNSTISQNNANNNGGGLFNRGTANVYNATIAFNGADADADALGGSAGGVYNDDGAGAVFNLRNTLVAGNYVHNAPVYDDCTGTINTFGANLFYNVVGCALNGPWTTYGALTTLGPLQNNGGATATHALLKGSKAIDSGESCTDYNGVLQFDQRGVPRPAGPRCDVGAFELSQAPQTRSAIEYHHAAFDHYFITAIADEITKLDNGTFVGWTRTGQSFPVFLDIYAGLFPVCRFFSTAFDPKSSHFYTPDSSECANVIASRDWKYEGVVMYVVNADGGGNCPAGTQPVYRMYNNGQGGAPNHRYTTSLAIRAQMLALGWIPEGYGPVGVIMCAAL